MKKLIPILLVLLLLLTSCSSLPDVDWDNFNPLEIFSKNDEEQNIEQEHTHSYTANVIAPTCTADGYTAYTCTNCTDSYVADEVKSLGHAYTSVVTEPTCESAGYTPYTCTNCTDS